MIESLNVVAWFTSPKTTSILQPCKPVSLPFLTGYMTCLFPLVTFSDLDYAPWDVSINGNSEWRKAWQDGEKHDESVVLERLRRDAVCVIILP